mgnify:CR=1 FL=1
MKDMRQIPFFNGVYIIQYLTSKIKGVRIYQIHCLKINKKIIGT